MGAGKPRTSGVAGSPRPPIASPARLAKRVEDTWLGPSKESLGRPVTPRTVPRVEPAPASTTLTLVGQCIGRCATTEVYVRGVAARPSTPAVANLTTSAISLRTPADRLTRRKMGSPRLRAADAGGGTNGRTYTPT